MKLLGLRLCDHDSNISYFDGTKLHYFKSERKYQVKHHAYKNLYYWKKDIKDEFGIDYNDIDEIAIVVDPWQYNLPTDKEEFFPAIPWNKLDVDSKVYRVNHHYAHALSLFPILKERPEYEIIIDGFGDYNNAWTVFKNDKVYKRGYVDVNGTIGWGMCDLGRYLRIKVGHEEDYAGKVMGIQSYGNYNNDYADILNYDMYSIDKLFDIENYYKHMGNNLLADLKPLDYARTVHDKVNSILLKFFEDITNKNYDAKISYTGGVAMNVIWNTTLKQKFKNLVIPPHCADDGISLGAIEYLRKKNNLSPFKLDNFPFIQKDEKPNEELSLENRKRVAKELHLGKTVALYQNNGEIGPRALGNRSLLINPTIKDAKKIINKIKKRENYRPFGASILREYQQEYFATNIDNPYMLYVGKTTKDNLQSITHVDGTCRYQTVDIDNHILYDILQEFNKLSGVPVLLNTSLNVNGKPIISNMEDTMNYFRESEIDVLVCGNDMYKKE